MKIFHVEDGFFHSNRSGSLATSSHPSISLPHLVLAVGTMANVFLLVRIVEESTHWRDRNVEYLIVLGGSGLFALFCFWQLFRELAQYRPFAAVQTTECEAPFEALRR
eukprot:g10117.t1